MPEKQRLQLEDQRRGCPQAVVCGSDKKGAESQEGRAVQIIFSRLINLLTCTMASCNLTIRSAHPCPAAGVALR